MLVWRKQQQMKKKKLTAAVSRHDASLMRNLIGQLVEAEEAKYHSLAWNHSKLWKTCVEDETSNCFLQLYCLFVFPYVTWKIIKQFWFLRSPGDFQTVPGAAVPVDQRLLRGTRQLPKEEKWKAFVLTALNTIAVSIRLFKKKKNDKIKIKMRWSVNLPLTLTVVLTLCACHLLLRC